MSLPNNLDHLSANFTEYLIGHLEWPNIFNVFDSSFRSILENHSRQRTSECIAHQWYDTIISTLLHTMEDLKVTLSLFQDCSCSSTYSFSELRTFSSPFWCYKHYDLYLPTYGNTVSNPTPWCRCQLGWKTRL